MGAKVWAWGLAWILVLSLSLPVSITQPAALFSALSLALSRARVCGWRVCARARVCVSLSVCAWAGFRVIAKCLDGVSSSSAREHEDVHSGIMVHGVAWHVQTKGAWVRYEAIRLASWAV